GLESELQAKMDYLNASIYDKLLIYGKLPQEVEKVIFFDADIVLQKDPAHLFGIDLENKILAAVRDQIFEKFSAESKLILGIKDYQYFNSGVMLVNVAKWREENISQKSVKFARDKW